MVRNYKRKGTMEAMQWFDTDEMREKFFAWFASRDIMFETRGPVVEIDNVGEDDAHPGDYIVIDENNNVFVYSATRFERFFEVAP